MPFFRQGEVTTIDPDTRSLTLSNGDVMGFDYLVIATGSTTALPTEIFSVSGADARRKIAEIMPDYAAAKRVIIVGEGPVGVEMAGEYRDLSPDIEITVVSSADAPMTTVGNPKFSARVANLLMRQNINRIGGKTVREMGDTHVILSDGTRLDGDIVVKAVGITPIQVGSNLSHLTGWTGAVRSA